MHKTSKTVTRSQHKSPKRRYRPRFYRLIMIQWRPAVALMNASLIAGPNMERNKVKTPTTTIVTSSHTNKIAIHALKTNTTSDLNGALKSITRTCSAIPPAIDFRRLSLRWPISAEMPAWSCSSRTRVALISDNRRVCSRLRSIHSVGNDGSGVTEDVTELHPLATNRQRHYRLRQVASRVQAVVRLRPMHAEPTGSDLSETDYYAPCCPSSHAQTSLRGCC
jgi:hypothetical protein